MVKLYRTPDVLDTLSRNSRRWDSSGELRDKDEETPREAPNVLSRILKTLDRLVEEEMKKPRPSERKELTQNRLGTEAKTSGKTYKNYDYIFKDTLEMLNKYYLCVPDSNKKKDSNKEDSNKKDTIPDFETLYREMEKKIYELMMGTFDELGNLPIERYGEFESKVYETADAWTASVSDGLRIHPAFAEHGVNELTDFLQKKYNYVQSLQAEYDMLVRQRS